MHLVHNNETQQTRDATIKVRVQTTRTGYVWGRTSRFLFTTSQLCANQPRIRVLKVLGTEEARDLAKAYDLLVGQLADFENEKIKVTSGQSGRL